MMDIVIQKSDQHQVLYCERSKKFFRLDQKTILSCQIFGQTFLELKIQTA